MRTPGELAEWLRRQHLERAPFESILPFLPSATPDGAYAVQDAFVRRMLPDLGLPKGYKIGLTSRRMQQMCGLDEPVAGRVLERRVHRGATHVQSSRYVRLGVESELCILIKDDLPPRATPYALADLNAAVGGVAAAFELIDDRGADYSKLDALSLIADNSWNAGVVLGEPASGISAEELGALEAVLHLNGVRADSGNSQDTLSHPLAVVLWLCNHLHRHGTHLRAGEFVMTGSIVPTRFANAGEHYRFELQGLAPVDLSID